MDTLSVFPEGLSKGKSESPDVKLRMRVPPPPQPSFFTATVMLQAKQILSDYPWANDYKRKNNTKSKQVALPV